MMNKTWYYRRNDTQLGPVSVEELRQLAVSGQLSPTDLVWNEGMAEWAPASKVKGLFTTLAPETIPSAIPHNSSPSAQAATNPPAPVPAPAAPASVQPAGIEPAGGTSLSGKRKTGIIIAASVGAGVLLLAGLILILVLSKDGKKVPLEEGDRNTAKVAKEKKGKVSGKVKVGDKVVKFGAATYSNASDSSKIGAGNIDKDGTYTIGNPLGPGKYIVTVSSRKPEPPKGWFNPAKKPTKEFRDKVKKETEKMERRAEWEKAKWVEIPRDYSYPGKKRITKEILAGDNSFDIIIK